MARLGGIFVDVRAKTDKYKRDLAGAKTTAKKASKAIQKQFDKINFKNALIGLAAFTAAATIAIKKSIELANEQEAVEKRLEAVLRSTGEAAGFNIQQMKDMASAMQEVTTTGDEVILSGMAMLSTFKQIRGEGFERTMMAALDLSEVMQQDLRSSIVMLGKALNDPVANLGALSRAGIQFTKTQKDMIKELWKSGQQVKAQSILLKEIESQFGGAARAARDTFGGAMQAASNAFGDMQENIGFAITKNEVLIDLVKDAEQAFIDAGTAIGEWVAANDKLIAQRTHEAISKIKDTVGSIIGIYNSLPDGIVGATGMGLVGKMLFGSSIGKIVFTIGLINNGMSEMNMGLGDLADKHRATEVAMVNLWNSIKDAIGLANDEMKQAEALTLFKIPGRPSIAAPIPTPTPTPTPTGKPDTFLTDSIVAGIKEEERLRAEEFQQEIEFMNMIIAKEKEAEEKRLEIVKGFNEEYNEMGKTRFDLEREQVERMTEIYREAGVEENRIAELTAEKNKQIAESERQAKLSIYQEMAGGIAETFQMIAQAGGKQSLAAFRTFQAFAAIEAAIAGDKAVSLALGDTTIPSTIGRFAMAGIAGAKAALQVGLILSAQPPSFDSGGVSSARGVYQTGNIQEAHVPIPSGKIPVEINGGQEQSQQDIVIMNTVDPSVMDRYMASSRGQNAIINVIGNNPQAIRRISG